jgi:hypothetical protein
MYVVRRRYMKNSVIAIHPSFVVITTIIYALLDPIFFEINNNALVEGENFVYVIDVDKTYTQQEVEKPCKSPCPPNAEMCIEMCA